MGIYESWLVSSPIAHRGLYGENIPENSIAAFNNAISKNIPIELDVTALSDGTAVVFHDSKLARMTGKDGFISNCTSEEIKGFNLLITEDKNVITTEEKIPTLSDALDTIAGKVPVLIEIKNFGKVGNLEKEIWRILQSYKGEYAVASYNPYTLEWFKNNAPKVKRGQIASFFKTKEITGLKRWSLKRMKYNKKISEPHFIMYAAENMPNKYTKKYNGVIPVLTFTCKSKKQEMALSEYSDNFLFDSYLPKM